MHWKSYAVGSVVLLFLVGGALMPFWWSEGAQPQSAPGDPRADRFAADRLPPPSKAIPFDGRRAMRYLQALCKLGPRISGSQGMKQQQDLLAKHFRAHGAEVSFQRFQARQPSQPRSVSMANLIASWYPERKRRIILCGHYDTRPIADQEPDRRDWTKPFLSANDGTSSAAWLMEMAHHMKDLPTQVGVDFVLFDGEEYVFTPSLEAEVEGDRYFLGSEHFARQYGQRTDKQQIYIAAILLDLFAGKDAVYRLEQNSLFLAGGLTSDLWRIAAELKIPAFVWERGYEVSDDHLALNHAGIPSVDIIEFPYRHWHRLSDLPEHCSPKSMEQVARVITVWLQRIQ